jgi:hypothetical protein
MMSLTEAQRRRKVTIPVASLWSPLGDSASLYPRGLGVRHPPIVYDRDALPSNLAELYIEDICAAL